MTEFSHYFPSSGRDLVCGSCILPRCTDEGNQEVMVDVSTIQGLGDGPEQ